MSDSEDSYTTDDSVFNLLLGYWVPEQDLEEVEVEDGERAETTNELQSLPYQTHLSLNILISFQPKYKNYLYIVSYTLSFKLSLREIGRRDHKKCVTRVSES